MRTILYSGCYLEGLDAVGNSRLERTKRYLDYYLDIKEELGIDTIKLLDNGSSIESIAELKNYPIIFESLPNLVELKVNTYPYCWRAIYHIAELINQGYEKIIIIDTDGFIVSKRLAKYVKELQHGWTGMWCKKYHFPEAAFHVLCEPAFSVFKKYIEIPWQHISRMGNIMENSLPFTYVNKFFHCDRVGEYDNYGKRPQLPEHDYYGQRSLDVKIEYGKYQ